MMVRRETFSAFTVSRPAILCPYRTGLSPTSHQSGNFGEKSSTTETVLIALAILFPVAHSPKMFFADQNRPHFVVSFLSSRVIILRESGKNK
jgi:hypothetical protein